MFVMWYAHCSDYVGEKRAANDVGYQNLTARSRHASTAYTQRKNPTGR
jgi:hypothetical protein